MRQPCKYIFFTAIFLLICTLNLISEEKNETKIKTTKRNVIPSVEDTIIQQLGEKLYFADGNVSPSYPITVIETMHYYSKCFGQNLIYKFIVHSKNTTYHEPFTSECLDKVYKSYFSGEDDIYSTYPIFYNDRLVEQQVQISQTDIDASISAYVGYWIYLTRYENEFYIDDIWAWRGSFHISATVFVNHYMDGPYPSLITSFKEEANGDLLFKLVDSDDTTHYKLIDKDLQIFLTDEGRYVVPAKNVNKFEIIEYANNTGDLI